jgi:transposase InsO family protein
MKQGLPAELVSNNGPEFTSRALLEWSLPSGVALRSIEPGEPIQNAFAESFIGGFRDECPQREQVRQPRRPAPGHRSLAPPLQ